MVVFLYTSHHVILQITERRLGNYRFVTLLLLMVIILVIRALDLMANRKLENGFVI